MENNKIIDYCSNALTDEEIRAFEEELVGNQQLRQDVIDYNIILNGIENIGEKELRSQLQSIENQLFDEGFFIEDEEILDFHNKTTTIDISQKIEQRIKSDLEFKNRVAALKPIIQGIEHLGDNELRSQLSSITNTAIPKSKRISIATHRLSIAAGIIGILLISMVVLYWQKPTENQQIVGDVYPKNNSTKVENELQNSIEKNEQVFPTKTEKKDNSKQLLAFAISNHRKPVFETSRSEITTLDSIYQLFDEKNWDDAIKASENHETKNEWFFETRNLVAHILFEEGKYDKAANKYQEIIQKNESPFIEEAQYNQLLCYLALYNVSQNKSKFLINKILSQKNHPFYSETMQIKQLLIAE